MNKTTLVLIATALLAGTHSRSEAQQLPPIRQLGPVVHVAKEPLGAISAVRQLAGGKVLVNDIIGRRVVLFDSALASFTLVADTTSATASAYGARPGGLIAYRGDSTLFVDPASLSMLLIDPSGKIARVMSVPRASDAGFLVGGPFGTPGFDAHGRLVYRAPPRLVFPAPSAPGKLPQIPPQPDSAALIRVDLATRTVDTVTFFKVPKVSLNITQTPDGGIRVMTTINPLPQTDDWAILPDGSIALVRAKDFHVDWIGPDGTTSSSPKIPFQWERLTDEAKIAFVDSARIAIEKARASGQFGLSGAQGTRTITANGNTSVTAIGPGAPRGAPGSQTGGPTGAAAAAANQLPSLTLVSPSELPDYKPAFTPGATRADADGNLWIRTSQNVDGRPVYNVINRKGELIDRVQLPQKRALAGFGPGGVVYLGVRDGATAHLEVARVR